MMKVIKWVFIFLTACVLAGTTIFLAVFLTSESEDDTAEVSAAVATHQTQVETTTSQWLPFTTNINLANLAGASVGRVTIAVPLPFADVILTEVSVTGRAMSTVSRHCQFNMMFPPLQLLRDVYYVNVVIAEPIFNAGSHRFSPTIRMTSDAGGWPNIVVIATHRITANELGPVTTSTFVFDSVRVQGGFNLEVIPSQGNMRLGGLDAPNSMVISGFRYVPCESEVIPQPDYFTVRVQKRISVDDITWYHTFYTIRQTPHIPLYVNFTSFYTARNMLLGAVVFRTWQIPRNYMWRLYDENGKMFVQGTIITGDLTLRAQPFFVGVVRVSFFTLPHSGMLAYRYTTHGRIPANQVPTPTRYAGREFSHWWNSLGLRVDDIITTPTSFTAVYTVYSDEDPVVIPPTNGNGNDNGSTNQPPPSHVDENDDESVGFWTPQRISIAIGVGVFTILLLGIFIKRRNS